MFFQVKNSLFFFYLYYFIISNLFHKNERGFMTSICDELRLVATALQSASATERVVVQSGPEFKVSHSSNLLQWMPHIFPFPEEYRKENRATNEYFRRVFGSTRIKDISKEFSLGLDLEYKHWWGLPMTKLDVEKLFVSMALIKKRDLANFVTALFSYSGDRGYLHLSHEQVETLKEKFRRKTFETLDNAELKELYNEMIPFKEIETIFLNCIPATQFYNGFNITTNFEHLRAFVHLQETTRLKVREEYDTSTDQEERKRLKFFYKMREVQRLISFNHPDGLVFYEPKGLRYVFDRAEAAGAFALLMKAIKPDPEARFHSQICFLPTQGTTNNHVSHPWESVADDAREEIGSTGAIAILDELHPYFNHIEAGFRGAGEKIDFSGYSLGGNQALRIAIALLSTKCVRKIFAVKLPYLDQSSIQYLNGVIASTALKVHIVTDLDDLTSYFGTALPGLESRSPNLKVRYTLYSHNSSGSLPSQIIYDTLAKLKEFPRRPICYSNLLTIFGKFITSLASAHPRETFALKDYIAHELRNYKKAGQEIDDQVLFKIQEFMGKVLLDNTHLRWETTRLSMVRSFLGKLGIESNGGEFVRRAQSEQRTISDEAALASDAVKDDST